jgi:hypothetical protein
MDANGIIKLTDWGNKTPRRFIPNTMINLESVILEYHITSAMTNNSLDLTQGCTDGYSVCKAIN